MNIRSGALVASLLLAAVAFVTPSDAQVAQANVVISPAMQERAKTHTLRSANLPSAVREESKQLTRPAANTRKQFTPGPSKPKLNVQKFCAEMHASLKDQVRGYALQVRKNGTPVCTLIWDTARSANQGQAAWNLETKMHVASVSKLVTAISAVKMLDERQLSFDTKIGAYLPQYWTLGPNASDITFRELLTHKAGFTDTNYDGDFPSFKNQMKQGVASNPTPNYTNGSFSLVRVLTSVMVGVTPKSWKPGDSEAQRDTYWDLFSQDAFENYVRMKVFNPSGVTGVQAKATTGSAFAYSTRQDTNGWDSGDLSNQEGGAGFRMSVNDVLDVMGTFRRKGTIVPAAKAQQAMDASLGLDWIDETPAGKAYGKNGWWGGGGQDGQSWHVEQAVASFLPDDMEAVVLANSNIGPQGLSLTSTFRNAVNNNIE